MDYARGQLALGHSPAQACESLVAEALKRGSTDNVSVLMVRLGDRAIDPPKQASLGPRSMALGMQRKKVTLHAQTIAARSMRS